MSAFIVHDNHIGAILRWYLTQSNPAYRTRWNGLQPTILEADSMFTALALENWRSVRYRYGAGDERPAPAPREGIQLAQFAELSPVEVIKACECLDYQSCEHPSYERSDAKRLIDTIKNAAIGELPGYRGAAWEVTQTLDDQNRARAQAAIADAIEAHTEPTFTRKSTR